MGNAEGCDEDSGDHHAQGGCLHAIVGAGFLPEENVQRPADARCQCITGPHEVNARAGRISGDQQ
ncbi:hypothetical protein D3C81_2180470 [compost metagenome]